MNGLQIDSHLAGIPWKTVRRHIGWRETTNYAAATQDMNPLYIDDERIGGIMAPPMFAITLGWPVGRRMKELLGESFPEEILSRDVHYTEYIEFYNPIRPGEDGLDLSVQAEITAILPQRSGTNVIYRYEVRDPSGKLCHVEYNGTMLRGVACPDGGKGAAPVAPAPTDPNKVIWEKKIHISPEATYIYDAATNIVFAIHTSPRYAHSVDLPDVLVTGSYTIALGVREMINAELGGCAELVRAVGAKLTAMIFPDSDITVQLLERIESSDTVELYYRILNETGEIALKNGYVKAEK